MTVTGKIQKFKMRDIAIGELGLEDGRGYRAGLERPPGRALLPAARFAVGRGLVFPGNETTEILDQGLEQRNIPVFEPVFHLQDI